MIEQNVTLYFTDAGLHFPVNDYEFNQYDYKIYLKKENYTLENLRELLFNLMRFTALIKDQDSDEMGALPCIWESEYFNLDEIEELTNSFLLIFRNTAFKTKEIQKNTADIDYLAMMMDLELE